MMDAGTRDMNRIGKLAILFVPILPSIAAGTMPVMLPRISDAFSNGSNGLAVKMVATALGLGMMAGAPLGGFLADRFGRLSVLVTVTILFAVFGCGAMFATELWELIASRFVVGISSGAIAVCIAAVIGDAFDGDDRSRWLGMSAGFATISIIVLNLIVGLLVDAGGWQRGFIIYAAAIPILLLILRGIPVGIAPSHHQEGSAPRNYPFPYSAIFLAVLLGTVSTGTSLYWPFRLRELGVVSAKAIALYALPNVLMVTLGAFSYGLVRRRLSINGVFKLGGLLSAVGLCVVALTSLPVFVAIGLTIEGLAVGFLTANLSNFAISISPPERRARTVGVVKGAVFGSPFLTQFALEPLSHAAGPSAALVAIAVTSGILTLLMFIPGFGSSPMRSSTV